MSQPYDSTLDTLTHSRRVDSLLLDVAGALLARVGDHDMSKLTEPEKSCYDEHVPVLQNTEYGTDDYKAAVRAMGEGVQAHYANNRHHPEHFGDDGVRGMTLVDVIEMLCDWKAASERGNRPGSLSESLPHNADRFGYGDEALERVLANTAAEFGW